MDKDININVLTKLAQERPLASHIGASLGTAIHQVKRRCVWQGEDEGFEKDRAAINRGESTDFIINRPPNKLQLWSIDVLSTRIKKNINGDIGVAINEKDDGTCDFFLPLDKASLKLGKATEEAVADALRGEGENFFINPKPLCEIINAYNKSEAAKLKKLADILLMMAGNINSCIGQNEKKVRDYEIEMTKSAVELANLKSAFSVGDKSATITIEKDE